VPQVLNQNLKDNDKVIVAKGTN